MSKIDTTPWRPEDYLRTMRARFWFMLEAFKDMDIQAIGRAAATVWRSLLAK